MSIRTDIHRPSQEGFDPQAYRLVHVADTKNASDTIRIANNVQNLENDGFSIGHGDQNHCGHCGAKMRYHALLAHESSHEYIFVGEECLGNRFSLTKEQFSDLRKRASAERRGETLEIDTRTAEEREKERLERVKRHEEKRDADLARAVEEQPILAYLMYPEADQFLPPEMRSDARRFRASGGDLYPPAKRSLARWMERSMARQAREDGLVEDNVEPVNVVDNQRITLEGKVINVNLNGIIMSDLTFNGTPISGSPRMYLYEDKGLQVDDRVTVTATIRHGKKAGILFGHSPQFQKGN